VAQDLDAYRELVEPWTPDRVAATCGIDADTVTRLAREFAAARPGLIRLSNGVQQSVQGEAIVRAVYALPMLAGHWRFPGGGHFCDASPVTDEAAVARPDLVPGNPRSLDLARLGETLTSTELDPPVHALMVWNANPAVSQPDVGRVRLGLARADLFTVVVEHFLTDTARYADIVLPSTTQLEHFDVQGAWGHHYMSLNQPAIAPQGETRSHGEIMCLLATAMGLDHPSLHETDEAIAASALPDGLTLDALRAAGWHKSSPPRFTAAATGGRLCLAGPAPSLPAPPTDGSLQLLTAKGHHFLNSSFANMTRQRRAMVRPTLDMHPADAADRGLVDGEHVAVANDVATVHGWLHVTDDVRPGVVAMAGKWWSTPGDTDAVTNLLTPSRWSPGGQPAYNETYVTVSPSVRAVDESPSLTAPGDDATP
jgi:anaerobic selenocysteine-containing dehydrogenase